MQKGGPGKVQHFRPCSITEPHLCKEWREQGFLGSQELNLTEATGFRAFWGIRKLVFKTLEAHVRLSVGKQRVDCEVGGFHHPLPGLIVAQPPYRRLCFL